MNDPLILITNDDGIAAKGIRQLVRAASRHGQVVVVAPDKSYSGFSHAISVMHPFCVKKHEIEGAVAAYAIDGSPVDCVKVGVHTLLERKPDLILSGINHGVNSSVSVHYSGTLGAAREGAMIGVRSLGFSLADYSAEPDMNEAVRIADGLIAKALEMKDDADVFYNVNIPATEQVKGVKVSRLAQGYWIEKPTTFTDPFGKKYIWLDGEYVNTDLARTDTDEHWLALGYATISPCKHDACDYDQMSKLETLLKD